MLFNQVAKSIGDPPHPVEDPDFTGVNMVASEDHDNKYGIPSLEKMGRFPKRGNSIKYLLHVHMF